MSRVAHMYSISLVRLHLLPWFFLVVKGLLQFRVRYYTNPTFRPLPTFPSTPSTRPQMRPQMRPQCTLVLNTLDAPLIHPLKVCLVRPFILSLSLAVCLCIS